MTMEKFMDSHNTIRCGLAVTALIVLFIGSGSCQNRSFTIDYNRGTFVKDGIPFQYISGSFHYFRSIPEYWDDVLKKFRLAGLDAVQTYVEWASHQPTPKEAFNFKGNLDIFKFFTTAQKNDLLVILRIGPFIDAERDMGGFPPWLLWQKANMTLRTKDLDYVYFVSKWFDFFLPLLKPYLYSNGGPIIMIQVENEYGSFSCDSEYPTFLRDLIRIHLGNDVLLFTTDGPGQIHCGMVPDVFPTVDFGAGGPVMVNTSFDNQRRYSNGGPLVNSEFYPGWLDFWGNPHEKVEIAPILSTLNSMLAVGASVNIYMFYGGTSFGFGAGSNTWQNGNRSGFDPCPTSYDYDAPLNEARDPTLKYFAIKNLIAKYKKVPDEDPVFSKKMAYGLVPLFQLTGIHNKEFLRLFSSSVEWRVPLTFEALKIGSGFVLYSTNITVRTADPALLSVSEIRDRAYVYIDEAFVGILSRTESILSMPIFAKQGQILSILVENQGRPSVGHKTGEWKGLSEVVTLGKYRIYDWKMYPFSPNWKTLNKLAQTACQSNLSAKSIWKTPQINGPGFGIFVGNFTLPPSNSSVPLDTFVRLDGWTKGMISINGFSLGKYWPVVGPQETLYLPGPLLRPAPFQNYVTVIELEQAPSDCFGSEDPNLCRIYLTDTHVIDGPTPGEPESEN